MMYQLPELITSTANSRVRLLRSLTDRKHRLHHGLFLAEGVRLAEEAVAAHIEPALLLYDPQQMNRQERARAAVDALAVEAAQVIEGTHAVVESAGDAQHGQGIVFAVPFSSLRSQSTAHTHAPLMLLLDAIADPGNVGTLLRTAHAAGWAPLLTDGTADPYAPRAVRAGAGVHFSLGYLQPRTSDDLARLCGGVRQVLVADARGDTPYHAIDWTLPTVLIVASEAHGAGPTTRQLATGSVRIPMPGGGESLNVGAAAAILCFEAGRQRAQVSSALPPGVRRTGVQRHR